MANEDKMMMADKSADPPKRRLARRRIIIIVVVVMVVLAIALGVGLGVGLTVGRPTPQSDSSEETSSATPIPSSDSQVPATVWKPTSGLTWQYDLQGAVSNPSRNNIDVWDIDLFENSADTISSFQSQGAKVVCYFSAGSYEDWRSDKGQFEPSDLGSPLEGWPGERWLNLNSDNVRKIMEARLDIAVEKKCDGVDPDNVDGYNNDNGLGLTQQDSVNYMAFLSKAAHDRGLAIGLKNAGDIIPDVLDTVQFSVNEQCQQYNECDVFRPFTDANKPVFHVEYPKGDDTNNNDSVPSSEFNSICGDSSSSGFSTILKNMDLDVWIQECPSS